MASDIRIEQIKQKYGDPCPWQWSLLLPVHWPVWGFVYGCRLLAAVLPLSWYVMTGKLLGRSLYYLGIVTGHKRLKIARTNIELCFPGLEAAAVTAMVRGNFEYVGVAAMEPALFWFASPEKMLKIIKVEGLERLPTDRNIILCGLHTMSIEAVGAICQHFELAYMYRIPDNPVYRYLSVRGRKSYRFTTYPVPKQNLRDFLRLLQGKIPCYILADQNPGINYVSAPFFGRMTRCSAIVSMLAKNASAAVVMMDYHWSEQERRYVLRLHPAIADFPGGDVVADTARINSISEDIIRQHPEQYLWAHRRFKHDTDADLYSY